MGQKCEEGKELKMAKASDKKAREDLIPFILDEIKTGISGNKVIRQRGYRVEDVSVNKVSPREFEITSRVVENLRDMDRPTILCSTTLGFKNREQNVFLEEDIPIQVNIEIEGSKSRSTYEGTRALQSIANARGFCNAVKSSITKTVLKKIDSYTLEQST